MEPILRFLQNRKYEVLLAALLQHLFIGIFLQDMPHYTRVIWPVNMVLLGLASVGVFIEKSRWQRHIRDLLFILVVLLPLSLPFISNLHTFMQWASWVYVLFFSYIFSVVIRFLIKPGYINADIISASACGYLLLLEISVFLLQTLYYQNPDSFKGIQPADPATIYIDFVYFCSILLTSIGFGDISPNVYYTKLLTAFFGIAGQFYSVVLIGILISKFTGNSNSR